MVRMQALAVEVLVIVSLILVLKVSHVIKASMTIHHIIIKPILISTIVIAPIIMVVVPSSIRSIHVVSVVILKHFYQI